MDQSYSPELLKVVNIKKEFYNGKENNLRRMVDAVKSAFRSEKIRGSSILAVDDISFAVHAGEIVGIVGKNGAGKSTLISLLSRSIYPSSGMIAASCKIISLSDLGSAIDEEGSLFKNVRLLIAIYKNNWRKQDIDDVIVAAGLEGKEDHLFSELPDGTFARITLEIAKTIQPHILLLDEVFANSSVQNARIIRSQILESAASGSAVLIVSHDTVLLRELCTRVIWLERGSLRNEGTVDDVITGYTTHPIVGNDSTDEVVIDELSVALESDSADETRCVFLVKIRSKNPVGVEFSAIIFDAKKPTLMGKSVQNRMLLPAGTVSLKGELEAPKLLASNLAAKVSIAFHDESGRKLKRQVLDVTVKDRRRIQNMTEAFGKTEIIVR